MGNDLVIDMDKVELLMKDKVTIHFDDNSVAHYYNKNGDFVPLDSGHPNYYFWMKDD